MSDRAMVIAAAVGFALLAAIGISVEVSVWNECRATHSFLYCWRVLGR